MARVTRVVPGAELLSHYPRTWFQPDLVASLSLWALLIPQGMAYAQLAGMPPETGLYAALAGMLLYALFGTSRYLTVGPESSVAILVAGSLAPLAKGDPTRYAQLAALLALLAGGILAIGYVARLGVITRLLSSPVLTGYLAGSAIVMIVSQLPKVLGITLPTSSYSSVPGGVLHHLDDVNGWAVMIAAVTAVVMVVLQRISRRLPAALIGMVIATTIVKAAGLVDQIPVVGQIPRGVPVPSIPIHAWKDIVPLLVPAASVALLVFSGSVLTARALAARDREDIDANREFIGLAAANVAAGLFRGFPVNASDSRSFVVATGGGRSQVVGLWGAGLVLLTLVALTPLFADVPNAALGGVVVVTAVRLIDVKEARRLWRVRKSDFTMAMITFGGVVLFGVLGGILVGVFASLSEMVRRTIQPRTAVLGLVAGSATYRNIEHYRDAETLPGLIVYRFDAPLFFGNADVLRDEVRELVKEAQVPVREVVLNAEGITDLDTTGAKMLERLLEDLAQDGIVLSFARVRTRVRAIMEATGLEQRIGSERIHLQVAGAVEGFRRRAREA